MASTTRSTIESLDTKGSDPDTKDSKAAKGPPAASPKPRSASDSSLYSTAGKTGADAGLNGLGGEGSTPGLIGMQGLSLVQRGIQMLNLAFPENPGLVAVLADVTGRLQTIVPQLVAQASGGAGMMGQTMQQPMGGQPPMGQPGMPPAPMGGGGAPPMQGGPVGPPVPPPM